MILKPVRITLSTTLKMVNNGGTSPFTPLSEYEEQDYDGELGAATEPEPTVFVSEGVMTKENGTVKISYDESQLVGIAGAQTEISFDEKKRDRVTMIRNGAMTTALVFDSTDNRNMCVYDVGPFPFEVMIHTDSLTNTVTYAAGGRIYAEYTLEIKGIQAETSSISLKVETLPHRHGNSITEE